MIEESTSIKEVIAGGVEQVHQLGYQSFKTAFLKTLDEEATTLTTRERAEAYFLTANIYALHEAPLMAKETYEKAIALNPDHLEAKLELSEVFAQMGDYAKAEEMLHRLKTHSAEAKEILADIEILRKEYPHGIYTKGDILWEMNEEIARENFDQVIDTFADSEDTAELQVLARAFGGVQDFEGYLAIWDLIASRGDLIELDFSDWFYMPPSMAQDSELWSILKKALPKISEDSFFPIFDSLGTYYDKLGLQKLRAIICDFYIALYQDDKDAIEKLKHKFPKCEAFHI